MRGCRVAVEPDVARHGQRLKTHGMMKARLEMSRPNKEAGCLVKIRRV
jgi:hypothetical protein